MEGKPWFDPDVVLAAAFSRESGFAEQAFDLSFGHVPPLGEVVLFTH